MIFKAETHITVEQADISGKRKQGIKKHNGMRRKRGDVSNRERGEVILHKISEEKEGLCSLDGDPVDRRVEKTKR